MFYRPPSLIDTSLATYSPACQVSAQSGWRHCRLKTSKGQTTCCLSKGGWEPKHLTTCKNMYSRVAIARNKKLLYTVSPSSNLLIHILLHQSKTPVQLHVINYSKALCGPQKTVCLTLCLKLPAIFFYTNKQQRRSLLFKY